MPPVVATWQLKVPSRLAIPRFTLSNWHESRRRRLTLLIDLPLTSETRSQTVHRLVGRARRVDVRLPAVFFV